MKGLKKTLIIIAVIAVVVIALYSLFAGNYNSLVVKSEEVDSQWAQVENQYQRRYDLIPNLVSTVKGYAAHESETFQAVTDARAKIGSIEVTKEVLEDPEAFKKFQDAQGELSGALSRLLAVTENYPELKANENFLALQDQLEGTENRISVERKKFNEAAKEYNVFVKQFPRTIIANMFGFKERAYFSAAEAAASAPAVQF